MRFVVDARHDGRTVSCLPPPASWPSSYGSDLWAALSVQLESFRSAEADDDVPGPVTVRRVRVLDVGADGGLLAIPIAQSGYDVTVVLPGVAALGELERRAAEAQVGDRVQGIAHGEVGSLLDVVEPATQHLVLCHGLLDAVDDLHGAVAALVSTLRPGGVLSAVVANRDAALISRLLAGQIVLARAMLSDADGVSDSIRATGGRFDVPALLDLCRSVGLDIEVIHGIAPSAGLVPADALEADPEVRAAVAELDTILCGRSPFRELSAHVHALARRPPGAAR